MNLEPEEQKQKPEDGRPIKNLILLTLVCQAGGMNYQLPVSWILKAFKHELLRRGTQRKR